jgi:hypothetical protein
MRQVRVAMLASLPQPRRALAAGPPPELVAGLAAPQGVPLGQPATVDTRLGAGPRELPRRQGRAFRAMAPPVPRAHLAAPVGAVHPGGTDAPTDAAGARGHPNPLGRDSTPRSGLPGARTGLFPLPQFQWALAAGAVPVLVAGITPTQGEPPHELATVLAGAGAVDVERARATGPLPVRVAGVTLPALQPQGRAPTVAAGPLGHPTGPTATTRATNAYPRCHSSGGRSRPCLRQN